MGSLPGEALAGSVGGGKGGGMDSLLGEVLAGGVGGGKGGGMGSLKSAAASESGVGKAASSILAVLHW